MVDFGSVSTSHPRLAGAYQQKMTSSKPLGGTHSLSILQLAKATNALTIGTMVRTAGTESGTSESDLPTSVSMTQLDELDDTQTVK